MKEFILIAAVSLFMGCSDNAKSDKTESQTKTQSVQKEVQSIVEQKPEVKAVVKKEQAVETSQVVAKTGESIYKVCAGCHGQNGEKAALGKSQIIQGWDAQKTADALNGYKAGTYGGAMKGVMKTQASGLGDEDIKLVSEYISKM